MARPLMAIHHAGAYAAYSFVSLHINARLNKKVFSLALNSVSDNSLSRISLGSSFQSFGPAPVKLPVPDVDLVDCMISSPFAADRRGRLQRYVDSI